MVREALANLKSEFPGCDDGGYELHGGGDAGLDKALYEEMTKPAGVPVEAGLESTVHSHVLTFAAEEARRTGSVIDVEAYQHGLAVRS